MKESNFSFLGMDVLMQAEMARMNGAKQMAFNWDFAAAIIKAAYKLHPEVHL